MGLSQLLPAQFPHKNTEGLRLLLEELEVEKMERNVRISQFLEKNPTFEQVEKDEFRTYYLTDVINNQPIYTTTHNEEAAKSMDVDALRAGGRLGLNLTGKGMKIGVWDGGVALDSHVEYERRLINNNPGEISNHATHVQGTIMAAGINPNARGMAYEASSTNYDFIDDTQEMTFEALHNDLLVSNHSYGTPAGWQLVNGSWVWRGDANISSEADWKFGFYDSQARQWDNLAYNHPYYTIVKSAGNDRNDTGNGSFPPDGPFDIISTYGTAKNIITVGAVQKVSVDNPKPSDIVMSAFSSWGPTDDGRIKPDIMAPGVNLFSSTSGSDNAYGNSSGTSMAAPSVSGSLLLIQQAYHSFTGKYMLSSSLKGLVIHTAFATGTGSEPDYQYGWGMMNTGGAVEFLVNNDGINNILLEDEIVNGGVKEYFITPIAGKKITATLVWTDLPGTTPQVSLNPTNLMLVNDLDMRIVDDSGMEIMPYILNPSSPGIAARRGDNFRDNVEKIVFDNPEQRPYTIRISHKNQLETGRQRFSLIVSYTSENSGLSNVYWIGNSGIWSDGQNWSLTSGGSPANLVPGVDHRAIFDENSFPSGGNQMVIFDRNEEVGSVIWLSNKNVTIDFNGHSLTTDATTLLSHENLTIVEGNIRLRFNENMQEKTLNIHSSQADQFNIVVENTSISTWRINPGTQNSIDLEIKAGMVILPEGQTYDLNSIIVAGSGSTLVAQDVTVNGLMYFEVKDGATIDDSGSQWIFDSGGIAALSIDNHVFQSDILVLGTHLDLFGVNNEMEILQIKEGSVTIYESVAIQDFEIEDGALLIADGVIVKINNTLHLSSTGSILTSIISDGKGTIEIVPHQRFCFDDLYIENVDLTGFGAVSVGENSTVINAENWFQGLCENLIFSDFEILYPCVEGLTYFIDKSQGSYSERRWMIEGVEFGNESTSFFEFDQTGEVEVTLIIGDGDIESTYTVTLDILENSLQENRVIVNPTQLASFRSATSYQWFRDGMLLEGEVNRVYIHNDIPGIYFVLTFDQLCNRKSMEEPFGTTSTRDEENDSDGFGVFPNPISQGSSLFIRQSNDDIQSLNLTLFNLTGKTIISLNNQNSGLIEMDTQHLQPGMYFLQIEKGNNTATYKVVKL